MKTILTSLLVLLLGVLPPANIYAANRVYDVSDFGLKANGKKDASPVLQKILEKIKATTRRGITSYYVSRQAGIISLKRMRRLVNIIFPTMIRQIRRR